MMNQSLLKGLVILLSINQTHGRIKLNKFKPDDYQTDFIETPTRFIFI